MAADARRGLDGSRTLGGQARELGPVVSCMRGEETEGLRPGEAAEHVMGKADSGCPADLELLLELLGGIPQVVQQGGLREGARARAKFARRPRAGWEQSVFQNGPEVAEAQHWLEPSRDPRTELLLASEIPLEELVTHPDVLSHLSG
jgi:hypothetical protein